MRLHIEQTLSNKAILIFGFLFFAALLAVPKTDGLSKSILRIGVILFIYKTSLSFLISSLHLFCFAHLFTFLINRYHSATTTL